MFKRAIPFPAFGKPPCQPSDKFYKTPSPCSITIPALNFGCRWPCRWGASNISCRFRALLAPATLAPDRLSAAPLPRPIIVHAAACRRRSARYVSPPMGCACRALAWGKGGPSLPAVSFLGGFQTPAGPEITRAASGRHLKPIAIPVLCSHNYQVSCRARSRTEVP
jgi:hypothetical protein